MQQFAPVAPSHIPTVAEIIDADIRPIARAIDADGIYPEAAMRRLGAAGAYGHHVDGRAKGGGLRQAIHMMADVGETCLSTAFSMWCQNALAWYLDQTPNAALRRSHLAAIVSGDRLGGTGLSNPMKAFSNIEPLALRGEAVSGGYRVTGRLPWVSNLGDDHLFASIFALADGRRVMALFECRDPAVEIRQNARFIALEGTRTFTVGLRDVLVPHEHVIAEDASTFVPSIRQAFVLLQLGMALGVARGAAKLMTEPATARAAQWLPLPASRIEERALGLEERAATLARNLDDPSRPAFLDVLRLRLEASWLAVEATQSAVLALGSRGYLAGSEAHRRQREAQFVAIVTPSVKHITKELAAG